MKDERSYVIVDKGLEETEQSCILVDNGKFFGMGYLAMTYVPGNIDDLKEYLMAYRGNNYIRNLLTGYKEKYPSAIIELRATNNNKYDTKGAEL